MESGKGGRTTGKERFLLVRYRLMDGKCRKLKPGRCGGMNFVLDIGRLSWHLPEEVQEEVIESLKVMPEDLGQLILPREKDCWENCARVLSKFGNEDLAKYLPDLFEWFRDMNWLGSLIILGRIKSMPGNELSQAFRSALRRAQEERDEEWAENLRDFVFAEIKDYF